MSSKSIVLVNTTTQIAKRKIYIAQKIISIKTLVELSSKDCGFLREKSIVDCNSPVVCSAEEFMERCKSGTFKYINIVDTDVLKKLIAGVIASPIVAEQDKDLLR